MWGGVRGCEYRVWGSVRVGGCRGVCEGVWVP